MQLGIRSSDSETHHVRMELERHDRLDIFRPIRRPALAVAEVCDGLIGIADIPDFDRPGV